MESEMTITTEEAERLAVACGLPIIAAALRSLAAERDALQAENARMREALHKARSKYVELNDKDAAEAMAEIITEALSDVK